MSIEFHKNDLHLKQKVLFSLSIVFLAWEIKIMHLRIHCRLLVKPDKLLMRYFTTEKVSWTRELEHAKVTCSSSGNKRVTKLLYNLRHDCEEFLGRAMFNVRYNRSQIARWPFEHARYCSLVGLTRPKTGPTAVIGCCWLTWHLEWWVLQLTYEPWFLVPVPRTSDGATEMIKEWKLLHCRAQSKSRLTVF